MAKMPDHFKIDIETNVRPKRTMNFRITERRKGKTTDLVTLMKWNPQACMITHDVNERDRLIREYPFLRDRVFGPNTVPPVHSKRFNEVYIDNLDLVLPQLLKTPFPITNVTATGEAIDNG